MVFLELFWKGPLNWQGIQVIIVRYIRSARVVFVFSGLSSSPTLFAFNLCHTSAMENRPWWNRTQLSMSTLSWGRYNSWKAGKTSLCDVRRWEQGRLWKVRECVAERLGLTTAGGAASLAREGGNIRWWNTEERQVWTRLSLKEKTPKSKWQRTHKLLLPNLPTTPICLPPTKSQPRCTALHPPPSTPPSPPSRPCEWFTFPGQTSDQSLSRLCAPPARPASPRPPSLSPAWWPGGSAPSSASPCSGPASACPSAWTPCRTSSTSVLTASKPSGATVAARTP